MEDDDAFVVDSVRVAIQPGDQHVVVGVANEFSVNLASVTSIGDL
jgi:hypothetical protein